MHPNEQVIRDQVDAFIKGDIPGVLHFWAEDLVVHIPPGHQLSGDYHGGQQFVEQFLGNVMKLTGGVQLTPRHFFANDDHGVGIYTIRTQRNGATYEWQHVNVYQLSGGKITEIWWTPFDQAKVAQLLA